MRYRNRIKGPFLAAYRVQAFIGTDHGPNTPILTCQKEDEDHGFMRGIEGPGLFRSPGFPLKLIVT